MKGQLRGKNFLFICLFVAIGTFVSTDSLILDSSAGIKDYVNQSKDLYGLNEPVWYKDSYKCPLLFGVFPDKEDCSYFYLCVAGIATRTRCPPFRHFDKYRRQCLPLLVAFCDKNNDEKGTTAEEGTTTVKEKKFSCPGLSGLYPHPVDCSKYYKCTFFIPSLKTCPEKQLFDGVKKECRPEDEVHCGTRTRSTSETTAATSPMLPDSTTSKPITPETTSTKATFPPTQPTTLPPTTSEKITFEPTTKEITIQEPTTTEKTTLEPTTLETTTASPETTTGPVKPTGPPETSCDEDDLDCIITETGEIPDWFECPIAVGSYRHPVSKKLFIFCINWKPYVKKCGQDLIYSQEANTCVTP